MKISDEDLIEDLKRVKEILGAPPTVGEYYKYGKYSLALYRKQKKWEEWIKSVFNVEKKRVNLKISNEDLMNNLVELGNVLGRTPKKKDLCLKNGSKYSINAYKRAFGSFYKSLIAAGLNPHKQRDLTDEELVFDLKRVCQLLGHTPSIEDFINNAKTASWVEVYKRFGSWTKALIKAEIPVEKARNVSKQDIIDALNEWYKQNNNDTRCLEYWKIIRARNNRKFPYSCTTISNKFNMSWEDIMKQIDPKYETVNQFVKRGSFLGIDGNTYLSSIEKTVGDILYNFKIENKIISYEYEHSVCPERSWTCDFFINNCVWLEVDGMRSNRKGPYNDNNEKIEYYKTNNFNYKILSYNHSNIKQFISSILREA